MAASRSRLDVSIALLLCLVVAACGGGGQDGDSAAPDPEPTEPEQTEPEQTEPAALTEVTFLMPSGNRVPFFAPTLAQEFGWFEEEGLEVTVEVGDGSAAVVQQLVAGQVDLGLVGVGALVEAVAEHDVDLVSTYVYTTRNPYRLVTLPDSGITEIADLEGKIVGVSDATAGEVQILNSLLEDESVTVTTAVAGAGNAAAISLDDGDIDAYISTYPETDALESLLEVELTYLSLGTFEDFFDTSIVVPRSMVDESPEIVVGVGRAVAKATVFALADTEAALEVIRERFPEQVTDFDETLANFQRTLDHRRPIEAAGGAWGYHPEETWAEQVEFMREQGVLRRDIDPTTLYTTEFTDEINGFDAAAIEQQARQ